MLVLFRPQAEQELLEAQAWYESKAAGLGQEFAMMADAAIQSALANPFGHPKVADNYRRVLFKKFPYLMIYLPSATELLVVSFFHQQRKPGSWRK
ncbi:MAG: hypothetical protein RL748_3362 [Pseudomonadota bacterium]|jgi:hypothetical protein